MPVGLRNQQFVELRALVHHRLPLSALSAPAEVRVSDIVRGLALTSAGVGFEARGEQ